MFNYRRLIVYQRAVEYDEIVAPLIEQIRRFSPSLASHLERSGNSLLTAIAEGASADQPKMKAASYRTGKREGEECAISLDKALRRRWTSHEPTMDALDRLDQVVRMLAQLIRHFDPPENE